ncbi:unnamed protein product, partial [Medioppia subpectinata]
MDSLVLLAKHAFIGSDVIDLKDHFDQLCGQTYLLLLTRQRLDHVLYFHFKLFHQFIQQTRGSFVETIDSKPWVLFLDLSRLDFGDGFDGRESAILCQSHGNGLESVGERAVGVLF